MKVTIEAFNPAARSPLFSFVAFIVPRYVHTTEGKNIDHLFSLTSLTAQASQPTALNPI
jgi:hypothetical protein